jgi:hypothetical protein
MPLIAMPIKDPRHEKEIIGVFEVINVKGNQN